MWIDDKVLTECRNQLFCTIWQPEEALVVLGNSNETETECDLARCRADGVTVLKRYGGGGAVVLYPGCLIVSLGMWMKSHFHNDTYFKKINDAVALTLESFSKKLAGAQQKGLSDLCMGDRKFAGTSLFRSRNYLLYQASLICELDLDLIGSYLKHPSREPEYRAGRRHSDFLMGLTSLDETANAKHLGNHFKEAFRKNIVTHLNDDLCEPIEKQFSHRLKRAADQTR